MRVQGGNAYIDQVKDMLAGGCSSKYVSEKYDFKRQKNGIYHKEEYKYSVRRNV